MPGPGKPLTKGDPRINRKGRPPGSKAFERDLLQALGSDGRKLLGKIRAVVVLARRWEPPTKEELMALGLPVKDIPPAVTLTLEQWLKVVERLCPPSTGKDDDKEESAEDFRALLEALKAANG